MTTGSVVDKSRVLLSSDGWPDSTNRLADKVKPAWGPARNFAVSANVLEYDDTYLETVMHPAAPVASGLFALAELRPVSGRELLHGFIVGVETSCRVGLSVTPTHYRRG